MPFSQQQKPIQTDGQVPRAVAHGHLSLFTHTTGCRCDLPTGCLSHVVGAWQSERDLILSRVLPLIALANM